MCPMSYGVAIPSVKIAFWGFSGPLSNFPLYQFSFPFSSHALGATSYPPVWFTREF
ncbi:hypothetical protein RHGRI_028497 [Rhododendron griersonianum]|uniref:Uncharacterized protein n=1 Tax=Rhododendron griersonianum TaxID=479676 RepID=A0AAV6IID2_9ERIC|nr:hypothetical protein RHGRI_028497 [Rhododendron griersonianum]